MILIALSGNEDSDEPPKMQDSPQPLLHMCTKYRFVCFHSSLPSQQFFSHVRKGLPGLNQY